MTAAVHWYTVHVLWFTMYEFVREMTVNLSGEFSKDLVQKQDGRFPAGECALYSSGMSSGFIRHELHVFI